MTGNENWVSSVTVGVAVGCRATLVVAAGPADLHLASAMRDALAGAVAARLPVIVDISDVAGLTSGLASVLLNGARRATREGLRVLLVCTSTEIARGLVIAGMATFFEMYASRAAAERELAKWPV